MPEAEAASSPTVSIIIPTYESSRTLEACLKSILGQTYHLIEVIVVDGYSRDGTGEIAMKYGARVILASGTQAEARNLGLAESKGEYILFLDSDQRLTPRVVEECVGICMEDGAEAVKIPEAFMGLSLWGRSSALWKRRMVEAWGREGGIPRFYRREILMRHQAFDGRLRFWEDMELYERIRESGLREAKCRSRIIHLEPSSLRRITEKYIAYGRSLSALKGRRSKARRSSTLKLTISTMIRLMRDPGGSLGTFLGCIITTTIKALSIIIGHMTKVIQWNPQNRDHKEEGPN